jgi:hypothetical protein
LVSIWSPTYRRTNQTPRVSGVAESAGAGRRRNVLVAIGTGVVSIPRHSRDQLLDELRQVDDAKAAVAAFEAAHPVKLSEDDKELVVEVIDLWMRNLTGPEKLPGGIFQLRNALIDDLNERPV